MKPSTLCVSHPTDTGSVLQLTQPSRWIFPNFGTKMEIYIPSWCNSWISTRKEAENTSFELWWLFHSVLLTSHKLWFYSDLARPEFDNDVVMYSVYESWSRQTSFSSASWRDTSRPWPKFEGFSIAEYEINLDNQMFWTWASVIAALRLTFQWCLTLDKKGSSQN